MASSDHAGGWMVVDSVLERVVVASAVPDWELWYRGELQGVYALLVVPALFLIFLAMRRVPDSAAARFVHLYCLLFTIATLLDPISTGLLVRGASPNVVTAVSLLFVLLGDFRVFYLVFRCAGEFTPGRSLALALAFTPIVPLVAYLLQAALRALAGAASPYVLYLCHELLFVGMALCLRARFGKDAFLRRCLGFILLYYGLWATADVLILSGVDLGWLLRVVPNQLYYAFWTPVVWWAAARGLPSRFPSPPR